MYITKNMKPVVQGNVNYIVADQIIWAIQFGGSGSTAKSSTVYINHYGFLVFDFRRCLSRFQSYIEIVFKLERELGIIRTSGV